MKDEVFDELLKRKIDADDHPFSPSDVNRVHQFVRQNLPLAKPIKWYQKFTGKLFIGGAMIASAALSIGQLVKNDHLEKQFEQLDKKLTQNQSQLLALQKKQSVLENENQQLIAQNKEITTQLAASQQQARHTFGMAGNVPQNLKKSQNNSTLLFAKNAEIQLNQKNGVSLLTENKLPDQNSELPNVIQVEKLDTQNKKGEPKTDHLAFAAKPTKDTVAEKDSLMEVKKMLNKFNYSLGIAGNIGAEERGFGLVINLVQNNKWQIQSGIRINYFDGRNYEDEEDYWKAEKISFETEYNLRNTIQHIRDIHNIQFKYSVIQIPLSISYLMPLKKDVSFILGAGTKFLMRTNEFVTYNAKIEPGSNLIYKNSFDMVKTNLPKVNDVMISLGVQKNWKRFSFQSFMYLDKALNDTKFRQMPMSAGFSMHLLYNLRK